MRGRAARVTRFIERHPAWALIVLIAIALLLWLVFAVWPPGLEGTIGKKKVFLNAIFNGITLGGLYFLVASGFTLIFGLMRNVNLAHGSLYLFGGYVGYGVSAATGSWILGFVAAFLALALVGVVLQIVVFRRMEGQDLRQTMVTIGLSIVFADLMLWAFGGDFYQIQTPNWLIGPIELPFVTAVKSSGEAVLRHYLAALRGSLPRQSAIAHDAAIALAAQRLQRTPVEIAEQLSAAEKAARRSRLDRRTAAKIISARSTPPRCR